MHGKKCRETPKPRAAVVSLAVRHDTQSDDRYDEISDERQQGYLVVTHSALLRYLAVSTQRITNLTV